MEKLKGVKGLSEQELEIAPSIIIENCLKLSVEDENLYQFITFEQSEFTALPAGSNAMMELFDDKLKNMK